MEGRRPQAFQNASGDPHSILRPHTQFKAIYTACCGSLQAVVTAVA
jgi:hypothetical protein